MDVTRLALAEVGSVSFSSPPADPGRRRIVDRLSNGPASVSELARPMAMTLAGVVQHIQILEASSLVVTKKVGRVRTCRVGVPALTEAAQWFAERKALWDQRLDRRHVVTRPGDRAELTCRVRFSQRDRRGRASVGDGRYSLRNGYSAPPE